MLNPFHFVALSGDSPNDLCNSAKRLLEAHSNLLSPAILLQHMRGTVGRERVLLYAHNLAELRKILQETAQTCSLKSADRNFKPKIVFMFTGQGLQYPGMALGLYQRFAFFKEALDHTLAMASDLAKIKLHPILYPSGYSSKKAETAMCAIDVASVILLVFQYVLARFLIHYGIVPHMMIGHSIGEYVVAVLAGTFSMEDAIKLVMVRGRLMQALPKGKMLGVPLTSSQLRPILPATLSIAADHGDSTIVSGLEEQVDLFAKTLKKRLVLTYPLPIERAGHSKILDSIREDFLRQSAGIGWHPPYLPYLSTLTGKIIDPNEGTSPLFWFQQMRDTVQFSQGIELLLERGYNTYLELGPGNVLTSIVAQKCRRSNTLLASFIKHKEETNTDDLAYFFYQLGHLWRMGVTIDFAELYLAQTGIATTFMLYPLEQVKAQPVAIEIMDNAYMPYLGNAIQLPATNGGYNKIKLSDFQYQLEFNDLVQEKEAIVVVDLLHFQNYSYWKLLKYMDQVDAVLLQINADANKFSWFLLIQGYLSSDRVEEWVRIIQNRSSMLHIVAIAQAAIDKTSGIFDLLAAYRGTHAILLFQGDALFAVQCGYDL